MPTVKHTYFFAFCHQQSSQDKISQLLKGQFRNKQIQIGINLLLFVFPKHWKAAERNARSTTE